jgi:hypothetical protein
MNFELIIKALKIQMRRIEEAISAVEAVAEDEIQGRHDARENIRAGEKKPAPGERPSQYAKDKS